MTALRPENRIRELEAEVEKLRRNLFACTRMRAKAEAKLAEEQKERHAISVQCGEERKARHAAEKVNADEVLAKRTNLLARIEVAEADRDKYRDQLREERAELEAEEHAAQLVVDELRAERDGLAEALENLLSYAENLPHRDLDLWSGWLDFQANVVAARSALERTAE